jgi:hypothetical protein
MKKYTYVFVSFSILALGSLISAAEKDQGPVRQDSITGKKLHLILQQKKESQEKADREAKLAAERSQQTTTPTQPSVSLQSAQTVTPEQPQARESKLSFLRNQLEEFPTDERDGEERE